MNDFLHKFYYQNNLKTWGLSLGIIVLSFVLGKIAFWFVKKFVRNLTGRSGFRIADLFIASLEGPIVAALVSSGTYYGITRLNFPAGLENILSNAYIAFLSLTATWFLARFTRHFFDEYLKPLVESTENDLDDQLLPVLKKGVIASLWVLGILVALNNVGLDVGALLAGMGIGGLALAMAAKDSISNFFGGITIFTDRPFKLGDRVKLNGFEGFVEDIGLRSTRLRTLEGRIVSVPNAKFTESIIENVSLEPSRKVLQTLGLVYSTTPEQMRRAQELLVQLVQKDQRADDKVITSFSAFADSSLNLTFIYYIKAGEDIFMTMNDINLEVLAQFNAEGLSFAYPTYSLNVETLPG